ncbi:MAG: 30S ribosomal protein S15 [Patescibacteria group bacterium]|nr:30S ribosomal protein S15 [Patescibacteria group bacterium]MCL5257748.1 30S ribosomal protein S15 [Patescibacteria group bacterium]
MSVSKQKIQDLIKKFGHRQDDSGGVEVQIAVLTDEILNLTHHLQKNHSDQNSKRGLILKVGHRKKLLTYLQRKSVGRYKKIVSELKL